MNNLSKFLKSIYITKFSFYLLIILIILSFSITFYLLLPNNQLVKDPINLQYFLLVDVILVLFLLSIIIRQIVLIFIYRKNNYDESRLYVKFINLFTAMALGPAIGVVIITSLFYNLELRTWYVGAVKNAVINSNIVARDYENEIQAELISDTELIVREINKTIKNNQVKIDPMLKALSEFINLRTIANIYIFNKQGEVLLSFKDENIKNFKRNKQCANKISKSMSIKIIKKILILYLFCFTFETLSAEENLKSIGKFKDWESFVLLQDGNKTCFAQSIPVVKAPKKLKREPSRLFVSFRPAENIKNEISVTNGYEFKQKAPVSAKSGKKSYDLFSKGRFAWVVDSKDEAKLIVTMKKASRLMIIGNTDKGDQTTDHYSMMGFTKAYNTAKKSCS